MRASALPEILELVGKQTDAGAARGLEGEQKTVSGEGGFASSSSSESLSPPAALDLVRISEAWARASPPGAWPTASLGA